MGCCLALLVLRGAFFLPYGRVHLVSLPYLGTLHKSHTHTHWSGGSLVIATAHQPSSGACVVPQGATRA